MATPQNKKLTYKITLWVLLFLSIIILIRLSPKLFTTNVLLSDDYLHFWASGRLNLQGLNPFDPVKIEHLKLEQLNLDRENSTNGNILNSITLNLPWLITIIMPFALVSYPISRFIWLIFSIFTILVSTLMLWRFESGNPRLRWLALLVAFLFAPTISVLEVGQMAPLLLLGVAGFTYFSIFKQNDWLGGASLALLTLKPQVVLLLSIPILFWVIANKRWRIIVSLTGTIVTLSIISIVINPQIIQQYLSMLKTYHFSDWANPTIGSYLRYFVFGLDNFWLQFLPILIGLVWISFYWIKRRKTWNWVQELPIILFLSVILSPYTWTYDLVILIPAILLAAIWIARDWKQWLTLVILIIYLIINVLDLILHMKLDDFWFIWLAPALLIWFLIVRWKYSNIPIET